MSTTITNRFTTFPVPYREHRRYIEAATADNTRRAYRSAIRHYERWGGRLPASEQEIVAYLLAHADTLNPRTLSLRLTALRRWHEYQGFPDPTAPPEVRTTLRGIERVHGRPKVKARILSLDDLSTIVGALSNEGSLRSIRDTALLLTGFLGAFRRTELVSIAVEHLQWVEEGVVVMVPRSKTDQEGAGKRKALPHNNGPLCSVAALRSWMDEAGIEDGPVFRRITQWGEMGDRALAPAAVNDILRRAGRLAGLPHADELSGHSLRRGLATAAHRAGASMESIMRQGGWASDTVRGYIDEAGEFEDNAAGTILGRVTNDRS